MAKSTSNRIIATPSSYAKEHYLYIQEVGTLQSIEPQCLFSPAALPQSFAIASVGEYGAERESAFVYYSNILLF